MPTLKAQRLSLGLSQVHLADYLGISRGLLVMAETGHRDLPVEASIKLDRLYQKTKEKNRVLMTPEIQLENEKTRKFLSAQAQRFTQHAAVVQAKLDAMMKRYRSYISLLHAINKSMADLPSGKQGQKDKICLDFFRANALRKMRSCGPLRQVRLRMQVDTLAYQARSAQDFMI